MTDIIDNKASDLRHSDGTVNVVDLSFGQVLKTLTNSVKIRSVDYSYQPPEGWTKWCVWASRQGKVARILRSLSKNVISFTFNGQDEDAVKAVKKMAKKTMLQLTAQQAHRDWNVHGKTFLEPVWIKEGEKIVDLKKVVVLNPASVTIVWNSKTQIDSIVGRLPEGSDGKILLTSTEPGAGDEIVCYFQYLDQPVVGIDPILFLPEDLIFIPRYPDSFSPEGYSLLQENENIITNKFLLEDAQLMVAKAFTVPRMLHTIPRDMWADRETIKAEVRAGHTNGLDIFVPEGVKPEVMEMTGTQTGMPALEYLEGQFIAAMGFADSFTESTGSNRSVGEIQLDFFERDIEPERELFGMIFEERILNHYMRDVLGIEDEDEFVTIEWSELKSSDDLAWSNLYTPLYTEMGLTQKKAFWEYIGLPVDNAEWSEYEKEEKERKEREKKIANDPTLNPDGSPKTPPAPEQKPTNEPAKAPAMDKLMGDYNNPQGDETEGYSSCNPINDLLSTKPHTKKAEEKTAAGIRSELKGIITRIRDEISHVL